MERQAGFTLADLVLTVAIVAALATIALPALDRLLLESRMTSQVNALVHGIHLAKQSAHLRLTDIALCKSPEGRRCAHGGDWTDGWLLFVNTDGDRPPQVTGDEPALAAGGAFAGGTITANRDAFVFRPAAIRSTNGTFVFCDRRGAEAARALIVSYTGRPRTARRGPGGRALRC